MEDSSRYKFAELRRQAEALKAEGHSADITLSNELTELIHELEVHHIELELQHTELERTNMLLEKARQDYVNLFDFAPVGYIVINDEGIIVQANLTACAMLRIDRSRIIGQSLSSFLAQPGKDMLYIHRREVFQNREAQRFSVEITTREETTFHAQLNMEPVPDDKKLCRIALTDITVMKNAEARMKQALFREQEVNQLKAKLIDVISYEVPAPLKRALLIVDLLLNDEHVEEPHIVRHLKLLEHNIWYIHNFIKDVFMAYQLNNLSFQATFEPLDIVQFARNVAEDLEEHFDKHRIEFVTNKESHMVMLDHNLLRRVFVSLLNNAYKYSTDEIEFRIHADQSKVTIHFTDFGRGIPEDDQPHVFQLFYRGSNVDDVPGFGLGLSVVKQAVEAMDGTVQINSVEFQRTTVTIRIPTQRVTEENAE
jgi:PAS domain S-box-containing protein